jgi:hypothetical protein
MSPYISLYTDGTVIEVSLLETSANDKTPGDEEMNVGSRKTIGEVAERPGIGSSQTRKIPSLHNSFQNNQPLQSIDSPNGTLPDLAEGDPRKSDQAEKKQYSYAEGNIPIYVGPLHCFVLK